MSKTSKTAALDGKKVRLEAEMVEGCLRERYLAETKEGFWTEIATSDGPVSLYGSQTSSQGNSVFCLPLEIRVTPIDLVVSSHEMIQTFSAQPYGIKFIRTVSFGGSDSWLRVSTRLEPSRAVDLQSVADHFTFSKRSERSYSPSVGGFNPDAQYKAPLVLVQSKGLAFGIVPDVATLDRVTLKLCHHALDLDVTETASLRVGFIPGKLARHAVYCMDAQRVWKLEKPLENIYFLLVTATAEEAEAHRTCVRFHWERFGRPSQSIAAGASR